MNARIILSLLCLSLLSSRAVENPAPSDTTVFIGCCDASSAVALTDDLFVVANDEDSVLRVYSRKQLGRPVSMHDLTGFLNSVGKSSEVDIEGSARIGDTIYWISSHGRNAKAKAQASRHRFFATTVFVRGGQVALKPVGTFYSRLLYDLARDPRHARFGLSRASQYAPKSDGALNIEGLAATPEGHLLIGFRNPVPNGKALLVRLLNPAELIAGKPARFGEPILLDLGGQGIRSIEFWRDHDRYVVIGGASDGTPGSRLYEWSGGSEPPRSLPSRALGSLNPEAIAFYGEPGAEELLVISDDGTLQIRGQDCKKLKDPNLRRFRAVTVSLASLAGRHLAGPSTAGLGRTQLE